MRKHDSAPAARLGLRDRGRPRRRRSPPTSSCSTRRPSRTPATYDEPRQFPVGIPYVIVNGTGRRRGGRAHRRDAGAALRGGDGPGRALDTRRRQTPRFAEHPRRRPPLDDRDARAPRSAPPTQGRAVPLPTRREGPAKLTGQALYADDLVFPGAWYGATIRSTVPHARLLGDRARSGLRLDPRRGSHRRRHPGPQRRRQHRRGPADPGPRSAARSATRPSRSRCSPPPTARPCARRSGGSRSGPEALEPVFEPLESTTVFAHHELLKGDVEAALAEDGLVIVEATYRVGHQEQLYIENNAMIALPREDGGITVHGSLQCPYYVHKALRAGPRPRRRAHPGGPGGDRRRLRRQGGVPVDDRAPRLAAGAQDRAAGAHDLRPPRGPVRDDQAPPGGDPPPDRRPAATGRSWPRTSTW